MRALAQEEALITLIASVEFLSVMGIDEVVVLGAYEHSRDECLVDMVDRFDLCEIEVRFLLYSGLDKSECDREKERRHGFRVLAEEFLRELGKTAERGVQNKTSDRVVTISVH